MQESGMRVEVGEIRSVQAELYEYIVPTTLRNAGDTTLTAQAHVRVLPILDDTLVEGGISVMGYSEPIMIGRRIVDPDWEQVFVTLAPGEGWSIDIPLHIPRIRLRDMTGDTVTLGLVFEYPAGPSVEAISDQCFETSRTIRNAPSADWLQTDFSARSCFFRESGQIHFSCGLRRDSTICDDTGAARALSYELLLDGKTLHHGYSSKRAPKGRLRGVNGVFYRTDDDIWTLHGPAKIEHPSSFEVLDDGLEHSSGCRSGYARDKEFVYFFDEESETRHATRVRACKDPAAFRRIGPSHFTDGRSVYWRWSKIPGADPDSFQTLGYSYGRDSNSIWIFNLRLEHIDRESFTLIDDPSDILRYRKRELELSGWARDKFGLIYCGDRMDKKT
ncbi:MAG: DKNYY domain-containing protein [Pikeienuella sp.]